jgi:hypothetical protein
MDYLGLISGLIIILAAALIIGIKVYTKKKATGKRISFDEFIDEYGQQIVNVLIDIIQLLKLDKGSYEDKNEYEYTIISITIDKLKENSVELGIDKDIIEMVDTDTLTGIVQKVLHNELMEIFDESAECVNIGHKIVDENETDDQGNFPYVDTITPFDGAETL